MTSQPDPTDGLRWQDLPHGWERKFKALAEAVNDMAATCDDRCDSEMHSEACEERSSRRPAETISALQEQIAALRVVPPEGGSRADDLERAADVLEWDTENGNDEERNAELLGIVARFRTFAAALRASGAGTRQEEAGERIKKALQHVADEIGSQLRAGILRDATRDVKVYWSQVESVARDALAESRPNE